MYREFNCQPTSYVSFSSVRAGDIMNSYDSDFLDTNTWGGGSPGDPHYDVGEIPSMNSKTCIMLVNKWLSGW